MHRFRVSPRVPLPATAPPRGRAVHESAPSRTELFPEEPLVLIVSRERASALPKLRELLQGDPEISIVVDRRFGDRRGQDGGGDSWGERRLAERRRRFSSYLL